MRFHTLILAGVLAGAAWPAIAAEPSPVAETVTFPAATPDALKLASPLEPAELVTAVLERNPGLAAARAAVAAAQADTERAGALEDPMASTMLAPLSLGGGAPVGYELRASQRIPYPGKRSLRTQAARSEATAAEAQLESIRLELAAQAVSLYADYYLVARELEINDEHLALLAAFKDVATARYAAGLVPQESPIQAEVEAARMLHHGVELRSTQRRLVAQLDALLHRAADAPLPPPPATLPLPAASAMAHTTGAVETPNARPDLRAARATLGARRAELELARRARYPDFEVEGTYNSMWDTPEHRFTVGLGVNVPIRRSRIRAEVAAAQARLEQASAELARLADSANAEAVAAAADREEKEHLVALYRDRVLPAARDQVAAARASFESGGESMLGLIEAERALRDAQQQFHEAAAGYVRAQAALSRALGQPPGGTPVSAANPAPGQG